MNQRLEPVHIPRTTLTRIAWSPFARRRWHVDVTTGPMQFSAYARWRTEAVRIATEHIWSTP